MALLLAAVLGVLFWIQKAQGATTSMSLDGVYQSVAQQYGEDWRLVKAFAIKESSENPNASNPGDPSFGLFGIQAFWLSTFGNGDPAQAQELLRDPQFATDTFCRILRYFRSRTNPHTLDNFQFPAEADIYNVGETLWAKGVQNVAYREFIVQKYQELSQISDFSGSQ
jgi:hypothetical protein